MTRQRQTRLAQFIRQGFPDFVDFGVAAQGFLAEDEVAVDRDFEPAAVGGDEFPTFDAGLEFFEQSLRHTDGAWGVVSNGAVFDGYSEHGVLLAVWL